MWLQQIRFLIWLIFCSVSSVWSKEEQEHAGKHSIMEGQDDGRGMGDGQTRTVLTFATVSV